MLTLLPGLLIGPLLVGGSTLAERSWGPHMGGLISVFPAIVGPVLFITASERGSLSASQAANGTLLGLVALGGFVVSYGWVARRARWTISLLAGWACAAALTVFVGLVGAGTVFPVGLAAAVAALLLARLAMPRCGRDSPVACAGSTRVSSRMLATGVLVALLSTVAVLGGPLVGGLLAGLPVVASVLAVSTHRRQGGEAVNALLRGMLAGMAGFVGFCSAVALLIVPAGVASAFAAATAVAVGLELLVLRGRPSMSGADR